MNTSLFDTLIWQFDRQVCDGAFVSIDHVLSQISPEQWTDAIRELIAIEMQHGWLRGNSCTVDEYRARYPQFAADVQLWDELLTEELIARRRAGAELDESDLIARFGSSAPDIRARWYEVCKTYQVIASADTSASLLARRVKGRTIAGRYEIHDLVGQGAHAEVYRAFDRILLRDVAVKMSRHPLDTEHALAARLSREALTIAQLQHPGIVSIFEHGQMDQKPYIVEEFIEGGTLDDRIRAGRIPITQVVAWMREICDAVDYAHQCGVVHRDLKPGNVLIDQAGRVRVSDFGLAALQEGDIRLTQYGELLGTPAYMSPEQVRGEHTHDCATDVYSLGATLYQMLTGQLPFSGSTAVVLNNIVRSDPPAPRAIQRDVPIELETICLKAMAKEADRRYSSARDMGEDLRRYMAHEPLRARRPGWLGLVRLWVRRHPATAATFFASALVVLSVAFLSFRRIANERNRFRAERDRANAALLSAISSSLDNELRVKSVGWYERATNALQLAATIPQSAGDRAPLRDLAIEMLLDPNPRMELAIVSAPVGQVLGPGNGGTTAVAMDRADLRGIVIGDAAGNVDWLSLVSAQRHRLSTAGAPIRQMQLDLAQGRLWTLAGGILTLWNLDFPSIEEVQSRESVVPRLSIVDTFGDSIETFAAHNDDDLVFCGFPDGHVEALRFGGNHWQRAFIWKAHDGALLELRLSPDGSMIASSSVDRTIKVWDGRTGSMVSQTETLEPARSLGWLASDRGLTFTCWETFAVYQRSRGGEVRELRRTVAACRHVGEATDRMLAVVTASGEVSLLRDNQILAGVVGPSEPTCFQASANSPFLVVGSNTGEVFVWQIVHSTLNQRFPTRHAIDVDSRGMLYDDYGRLSPENPAIRELSFLRNEAVALAVGANRAVAAFANPQGQVFVWREQQVTAIPNVQERGPTHLAIGNYDQWLWTCLEQGPLVVRCIDTMEVLNEIPIDVGDVMRLATQANGSRYVVVGRARVIAGDMNGISSVIDDTLQINSAVAIWGNALARSLSDGRIVVGDGDWQHIDTALPSRDQVVHDLRFSRDGELLYALYGNKELVGWDWRNGAIKQSSILDAVYYRLAIDPRSQDVVVSSPNDRALVFDAARLRCHTQLNDCRGWVAFAFDGGRLFIANQGLHVIDRERTWSQNIAVWEQESAGRIIDPPRETLVAGGHVSTVWSIDISPDDRWTASGSFDRSVKLWDNQSGQLIADWPKYPESVWRVRFSPDASVVAAGCQDPERHCGEVILRSTSDGAIVARGSFGSRLVAGLDFHPRQPWLAIATFDGTIAMADSQSLADIGSAHPLEHPIMDILFDGSGKSLIGACLSDGVAVWNIGEQTAQLDAELGAPEILPIAGERVWAVALSPDQKWLAAGCESGAVVLFDYPTRQRVAAIETSCTRIRYLRFSPDGGALACSAFAGTGCVVGIRELRQQLNTFGLDWY